MPRHRISVLLVDDHQAVVEALTLALEREPDIEVIGSACSVREVVDATDGPPDVAIVDYILPDGTGADVCRQIKARWPETRIVMLSGAASDDQITATLRAGADGFLMKSQRLAFVLAAVRDTYAHKPIVPPSFLGRIAQELHREPRPVLTEPLTPRELTVLRLLAGGASTRTMATDLRISTGTVLRHVEAIRRKFGAHSRLEAIRRAYEHHIVELAGP